MVAVVTGGTRGIGRAVALEFLSEGANVAVSYVSDDDAARAFLEEAGSKSCMVHKADVSDSSDVAGFFEAVKARFGDTDILVNNAGVTKDGFLMLMREEDWDMVIAVSLKGAFNCSRAACRGMIAKRSGRIINMVSPSAVTGRAGQTNYSAAKGGVLSLTRSLARELAQFGVTVNAICPGVINTDLTRSLPDRLTKELMGMIPLGRFGEAQEVARAAVYLASGASSYITGQNLPVDGGICI
jgi:3-oxoacyl-[acyl-carrier protein] reductase